MLSIFVILFFNILLFFAFVPCVKNVSSYNSYARIHHKEARYIMTCWKKSLQGVPKSRLQT